ncbi:MAG TPA: alpha/beta hydrolase [Stellaceae bacterium]|nr:alpha/beta hydrolase [Stellaceae bacterium]
MTQTHEIDIEEVEFLRHGEKPFLARVFRPRGTGPFPAVIEAHGGAWCEGNRANNDAINSEVAKGGIVVAALDFRNPPEATYPGSVADVNYGVRWLKSQAARFNTRPALVGSMGTSSGGHLVVLNGMKPDDPRYEAVRRAGTSVDARVPYVVSLWPVICPLGRYRDRKAKPAGEQAYQNRGGAVAQQERYWLTEEAMGEGSPLLALTRGDAVELPHILYVQNPADELHPRHLMEAFIAAYRAKGGKLETHFFAGPKYDLPRSDPASQGAKDAIAAMVAFIHRETGC